jgi:predicted lipoprotein with Yx(FWY)xxD motif
MVIAPFDLIQIRARRAAPVASVLMAMMIGVSACGGSSGTGSAKFTGPVYEVRTAVVSGLGTVLVDGSGYTLYLYEPDNQSGHSKCSGPCAVEWSPLTLPSSVKIPLAGPGAIVANLSTTQRSDGTVQVTYNGWPLYTWAQDTAPGQATGEGLNNLGGLWYVVNPAGNAIVKVGAGST